MDRTVMSHSKVTLSVLFASLLLVGIGNALPYTILPALIRELSLSEFEGGLITSVGALAFLIASPFWGRKSDQIGRKPVIMLGFLGYGLSFIIFAALSHLGLLKVIDTLPLLILLLISRPLFLLLSSGIFPASQAFLTDRANAEEKTSLIGLFGAVIAMGFVLGPVLGAVLGHYSLILPLYLVGVFALLALVPLAVYLPKTKTGGGAIEASPRLKLSDPRLRPIFIAGFLLYCQLAANQQVLGFFLQDQLGLSASQTVTQSGFMLALSAIIMALIQAIILPWLKPSSKPLFLSGLLICTVAFAILMFSQSYWHILFAVCVLGIGFGFAAPGYLAIASDQVSDEEQGACAGLVLAVQGLAFVAGPVFGGAVYGIWINGISLFGWTISPSFAVASLLCLIAVLVVSFSKTRIHNSKFNPDRDDSEPVGKGTAT